ncbi:MAG: peptidylprolyl isomerase [Desulfuromonadaceae bacterium]
MMKAPGIYVAAFSLACCGISLAAEVPPADPGVIATVAGQTVSVEYLKTAVVTNRKSGNLGKLADSLTPEGREKLLDDLLYIKTLAIRAKESGLAHDPSVKAQVDLATDSILAQEFLTVELGRLDLSENGLRTFYTEHSDQFRTERKVKARHIVTATREDTLKAWNMIIDGKDFGELASRLNVDATKQVGGSLDWVKRGIFVKNFEEALFSLGVGETSEVIQTPFGYHIIKVEAIDAGTVRPFESVKEDVQKAVVKNHVQHLKEKLRKEYPVLKNQVLLKAVDM